VFILNPYSGLPIYRQLAEQIRRMVASGQLAPGVPLPSIRELALKHAINPMTVSKVYNLLESEGVLERHRGKPMTVAERPAPKAPLSERLDGLEPHLENLILAARQLELDTDELVDAVQSRWEKRND
jgi:GntR family transcriptional regulator